MPAAPNLTPIQIETVCKIIAEEASGTDISRYLAHINIQDTSGESTKWRRLDNTFRKYQALDRGASKLFDFIKLVLEPSRYVSDHAKFEELREEINKILSFQGVEYSTDGNFREATKVRTIEEAHKRLAALTAKFRGRRLHHQVEKYCKVELLQENYFHAVFEATKGLAQRTRELTGLGTDGAALVDAAFSINSPLLAFNTLQTETEQSEHKGFAMLLKGCFGAVRNPLAHQPKILWQGDDDAADYLTIVSLLHRKLDSVVPTRAGVPPP
jgi:uncharacterized protein (TIGR02391 family)